MTNSKILVVDDEPQIRRVMRSTLSAEGYIVADAKTGEEGLVKLRQDRPDLVLLDMNMPGIGGLAACREMRASSEVPIIMLTVKDTERDKVDALDAGADDYVTKPFSMPELLARVRANLRRVPFATDAETPLIIVDNIQINLATHHVQVDGRDIRFTPKEFELLQILATNPNVSIPHSKLLQAVWGPDYGDQIEYLHVFINQIRKKIEPEPSKPRYILTEPWLGYRFKTNP
jgi:two-component system KDP operon response regulator KdpE